MSTEILHSILLAVCAFWLGACPFSVWVGQWLLGEDVRRYGDGNPGAANVFHAGSRKAGSLAVFLDVAKGAPFVMLANSLGLPDDILLAIGLSAILGHAFSPFLRFKGGKSVAVTFGVLLALPQHDMLAAFTAFIVLGFLLIESHSWIVMLGPAGTLVYMAFTRGNSWESAFISCVLAIFFLKHHSELQTIPRPTVKLVHWIQSRRREA